MSENKAVGTNDKRFHKFTVAKCSNIFANNLSGIYLTSSNEENEQRSVLSVFMVMKNECCHIFKINIKPTVEKCNMATWVPYDEFPVNLLR
jgi:hypothetical protein